MSYYDKYIKYKMKYIKLKQLLGGHPKEVTVLYDKIVNFLNSKISSTYTKFETPLNDYKNIVTIQGSEIYREDYPKVFKAQKKFVLDNILQLSENNKLLDIYNIIDKFYIDVYNKYALFNYIILMVFRRLSEIENYDKIQKKFTIRNVLTTDSINNLLNLKRPEPLPSSPNTSKNFSNLEKLSASKRSNRSPASNTSTSSIKLDKSQKIAKGLTLLKSKMN